MSNAEIHQHRTIAARQIAVILKTLQRRTGRVIRSVCIDKDRETIRAEAAGMQMDVIVDLSEEG